MKYLIIVPDGVGIRNFLCSRFLNFLIQDGQVIVWHALSEPTIKYHRDQRDARVQWYQLPYYHEGIPEQIMRYAKLYAQLYRQDEEGTDVVLRLMRPPVKIVPRVKTFMSRRIAKLCGLRDDGVLALDKAHAALVLRKGVVSRYERFLNEVRPDVVFCTHQRSSIAVPPVLAARRLKIPTATFIYSWDNLPKGRMAVHSEHFLVWSDFMKEEMKKYYPEVESEKIHIVGTPQFEHYFNSEILKSKDDFFCEMGLDSSRPVICFSGDDFTTSPHDQVYLADLAEALRPIPLSSRPQILFRRCPTDNGSRYGWVIRRYPEIVVSEPCWISDGVGDWTQVVPTMEDISLLVNIVYHCDLVVNIGSTMAMDFAVLDKPGVFICYNPAGVNTNSGWDIHDLYRLPHFQSVHQLQPVYWVYSVDELSKTIMKALSSPMEKSPARQSWLRQQLVLPLDKASERCYQALRMIAR